MSHTYSLMEVSRSTYDEVRDKLLGAEYVLVIFDEAGGSLISNKGGTTGEVLDMHGIALVREKEEIKGAPKSRPSSIGGHIACFKLNTE